MTAVPAGSRATAAIAAASSNMSRWKHCAAASLTEDAFGLRPDSHLLPGDPHHRKPVRSGDDRGWRLRPRGSEAPHRRARLRLRQHGRRTPRPRLSRALIVAGGAGEAVLSGCRIAGLSEVRCRREKGGCSRATCGRRWARRSWHDRATSGTRQTSARILAPSRP